MKILAGIAFILMLGGCSVDDAIARADRAAHAAAESRASVVAAIDHADQVAAGLKALAVTLDADRAKQISAQADALVATARAALPAADAALATANDAIAVAKKAQAEGSGWLNVLLAIAGVVIPGGGVVSVLARNVITGLRSTVALQNRAIVATADHADRMESAITEPEVAQAKLISIAQQKALGVDALIEALRSTPNKIS